MTTIELEVDPPAPIVLHVDPLAVIELQVAPPEPISLTVEPPAPIDLQVTTPAPIELEVASVGLVGATGAPGLDGHASYVQETPAAEWTWTHGLGRRSMPTLFLSTDLTEAVWTDVTHVDDNTLIVTWPTPVAGRIYL